MREAKGAEILHGTLHKQARAATPEEGTVGGEETANTVVAASAAAGADTTAAAAAAFCANAAAAPVISVATDNAAVTAFAEGTGVPAGNRDACLGAASFRYRCPGIR